MDLLDKNYIEDTRQMVRFLKKRGRKKGFSSKSPRSGIFKPENYGMKLKAKLEKCVIKKLWKKTQRDKIKTENEIGKMRCLLEVTQNLNRIIQRKEISNMLMCLDLFLEILGQNEYYYITRKGMLISVKIFFTLEEFDRCSEVTQSLLGFASTQKDYNCLVAGWMRLAECHSKKSRFQLALQAYFQVLKFAIISSDLASELKSYDRIGVVYFNLGDIKKAKFFHRKGLGVDYKKSQIDQKNKQMVKQILSDLFESGSTSRFELILEEFLQARDLERERADWKQEKVLALSQAQEMELIQYLFFYDTDREEKPPRVILFSPKKQEDKQDFQFRKDTERSLKIHASNSLFDSEEEPDPRGKERAQERQEKMRSREVNCECATLLFYETVCEHCKSRKRKREDKERPSKPMYSKQTKRFLDEKLKKKMTQLQSKFGFESNKHAKRKKANPKQINRFGESYFVAKDNHLQKKKVGLRMRCGVGANLQLLKGLKSIYDNQIVRTHLSNNRNLTRIKTLALSDGNIQKAILKSNLKSTKIWGISKSLTQFSTEIKYIINVVESVHYYSK